MSLALDVSTNFAAEFLELLCSQQYAALGRFFLAEASPDHQSNLSNVDASGRLDVYRGSEIPDALNRIFAPIARKAVVIEDVAANTISAGVTAVVTFSSVSVSGTFTVVLEHVDDETYFARDVTVCLTAVAEVPAPVVETSTTPVAAEEQPIAAAEPEVVAAVEEAAPVVVEAAVAAPAATSTKGRKGKKAAAPVATPAAPVAQVATEEAVEAPVQAEAPAVVETPAPAPAAAPVAPAAPTGPKSWATLARTPASAPTAVAPVKVRPPGAEAPVEAVVPAVATKEAKSKPSEAAPRVEDRLMFTIQGEVSDDDIKAALGPLSKSMVSLRNQSSQCRVFLDFSVATAFDTLSSASITIGGFPVKFQRQRQKA